MCVAFNVEYSGYLKLQKSIGIHTNDQTLCSFQNEFINTNICLYLRNKADLLVPLTNLRSAVYKTGLRLVSIDIKPVPCPYHGTWGPEETRGMLGTRDNMRECTNCLNCLHAGMYVCMYACMHASMHA